MEDVYESAIKARDAVENAYCAMYFGPLDAADWLRLYELDKVAEAACIVALNSAVMSSEPEWYVSEWRCYALFHATWGAVAKGHFESMRKYHNEGAEHEAA